MPVCPDCRGEGTWLTTHGRVKCLTCKGVRMVTDEHATRLAEGRRRYDDRVRRGVSLREEARALGMTPRELADLEHGR